MQHLGKTLSSAARDFHFRPFRSSILGIAAVAVLLAGCASRTDRAPIVDGTTSAPTVSSTTSATYVVQSGDTLYKIAQKHNMNVATLISMNNITDPSQLRVGQTLILDSSAAPTSGPTVAVVPPPASTTPTTTPVDTSVTEQPKVEAPVSAPRASDASLISWGWPSNGEIIQGFNSNTKGVDLAGAIGDPVHAAADGKVMYAGNGVRGLGNLILLGHTNGFITAYAHNESLDVKTGDEVKKGQRIASLGQSDTTSPRLHFEVRRRGTPVNPLSYLPERP
ncbi:MAG TPA: peptidoglycan DD-metalloendopeptidase family protein [Paenalcaligenes sp.]|nr:peptidoglycan DD-metalloendopeptidase family protein [Paenalcaligenes sp.]